MELLVASTLSGLMMALVVGNILSGQTTYSEDVIRTKINSNLRSSMDIMSMNIRQAGENLPEDFEVVKIIDGVGTDPDELTLRRNLISDVLTICNNLSIGSTTVRVSSTTLTDPECIIGNVNSTHQAFSTFRTEATSTVKAFLYDRSSGTGEFVDYTAEGNSGGELFLTIEGPTNDYAQLTSNIYLVEEWRFNLNETTNTLDVYRDGDSATALTVAFDISDFQARLQMSDSTYIDALDGTHATLNWKGIRQVEITLEGHDQRKDRVFTSSITAKYFPRNVLSF